MQSSHHDGIDGGMSTKTRTRSRTRAEIARAHRNTTAGIVRDYLTVHFGPDRVITHEVHDGRDTFCVRTRADRRIIHTLLVNLLVLEVHEGRLYKLAGLLAYLQVAHHLRQGGVAPLRINDRCELCEAHTGRALASPPGHLAIYGHEAVAGTEDRPSGWQGTTTTTARRPVRLASVARRARA